MKTISIIIQSRYYTVCRIIFVYFRVLINSVNDMYWEEIKNVNVNFIMKKTLLKMIW